MVPYRTERAGERWSGPPPPPTSTADQSPLLPPPPLSCSRPTTARPAQTPAKLRPSLLPAAAAAAGHCARLYSYCRLQPLAVFSLLPIHPATVLTVVGGNSALTREAYDPNVNIEGAMFKSVNILMDVRL
ncbi:hypothetical protein Pmani_039522 [Petrolisthes manimaculis]|uniref:Uncharacterized protein n=1 Tax=Petrolisthes manimaculis TaxID=1843537 RepID=A0AAE1TJH0_9EUCA|nr:hypothetical protein Pmani_039522 [Petrolisthes manimaculis]